MKCEIFPPATPPRKMIPDVGDVFKMGPGTYLCLPSPSNYGPDDIHALDLGDTATIRFYRDGGGFTGVIGRFDSDGNLVPYPEPESKTLRRVPKVGEYFAFEGQVYLRVAETGANVFGIGDPRLSYFSFLKVWADSYEILEQVAPLQLRPVTT